MRGSVIRPGWDEYFLGIAEAVSARADCRKWRYGAVIVKDHRLVSSGYNGSPPGEGSCLQGECPRGMLEPGVAADGDYRDCIALHAEQNAIAFADRAECEGATLYVTGTPCDMCAKLIKAAGIVRVVSIERS